MQPASLLLYFYELVGGAATHPAPPLPIDPVFYQSGAVPLLPLRGHASGSVVSKKLEKVKKKSFFIFFCHQ